MNLIRTIVISRRQIERLLTAISIVWNFALLGAAREPASAV